MELKGHRRIHVVTSLAGTILANQRSIPSSPATIDADGQTLLCGAAALAAAGLQLAFGDHAREQFTSTVAHGPSEALNSAFKAMSWSEALCERVREINDLARPDKRLETLSHLFQSLKPNDFLTA
jgi:hypothetical protein